MKEYKINTLQDILDCVTEENVDRFLEDFERWLKATICIEMACSEKLKAHNFVWIDDNKKNVGLLLHSEIVKKLDAKVKND